MIFNQKSALYIALAGVLVQGSTQALAVQGNTSFGLDAMIYQSNYASNNSAFGERALHSNIGGDSNTAIGYLSLQFNGDGNMNTASGAYTLSNNSEGLSNTATGSYALYNNRNGDSNTAVGGRAMFSNLRGKLNSAVGVGTMEGLVDGNWNNAVGSNSLRSITGGNGNSAQGFAALYNTTTGSNNMAIGNTAGYSNETGSGNVFLGWNAGFFETGSNTLYISNNQRTPLLYGQFHSTPSSNKLGIGTNTIAAADTIAVWNGAHLTMGGVWTNASSRELKDNIETLSVEDANAALEGLSPVRYVYKNSRDEEYVGFIAEDVPDLVATNDHKSLSPMDIVAVLTTVAKDQKNSLAQKDAEIAALRESLVQQGERLQRSATSNEERILQLEMALAEVLRQQSSGMQLGSTN